MGLFLMLFKEVLLSLLVWGMGEGGARSYHSPFTIRRETTERESTEKVEQRGPIAQEFWGITKSVGFMSHSITGAPWNWARCITLTRLEP